MTSNTTMLNFMDQAIEVITTRKRTLGIQPHIVIDGFDTGLSKWGTLLYPVAVGAHQLSASVQGIVATRMEVTVGPNEIVTVQYDVRSGLGTIKANLLLSGKRDAATGSEAPMAKGYTVLGPTL
jgi:hypothetical protein